MAQNYGSIDSIDNKENFQSLVKRISNNLQNIRQITKDLGELCLLMGGPHDTPLKKDKILQLQKRAKDLLALTKSLFESISHLNIRDEVSRFTLARVKEEYDIIVPKYNEVHGKIIAKMSQMAFEARQSMSIVSIERNEDSTFVNKQMDQEEEEIKATEEMLNRVKQLENNLVQVQQLYNEINNIVVESREDVEHIETNVIEAHYDVEMGTEKLKQATVYKQKALKKKICLIVVVIIILAIIGLIIGLTVGKKS